MKPAPPVTSTVRAIIENLPRPAVSRLAPLPREFYQRETIAVAKDLLGKLLVRRLPGAVAIVRLVEVEAYLGVSDPACHTFGGRKTRRTEAMWGPAGCLYVYFVYGMHHCANVVTREEGVPEAVLLRGAVALDAVAPVGTDRTAGGRSLAGPARLARGLGIDLDLNGADLTRGEDVFLAADGWRPAEEWVRALPRVGVHYAGGAAAWPLRFVVDLEGPLETAPP